MAGFTSEALEKKLLDLNSSQQSIQTLSLWLIHHRKHSANVVQTWAKEVRKAKGGKKLTLMYLANDVIQNSKKKGPEYAKEFSGALKSAFECIVKDCEDKMWLSLSRVLNVWEERSVYDKSQVSEWKKAIGDRKVSADLKASSKSSKAQRNVGSKSKRPDKEKDASIANAKKKKMSHVSSSSSKPSTLATAKPIAAAVPIQKKVTLPSVPAPREGVIIDPDALIRALQDLENSASSDAAVREKIASFPPEVTDPTLLEKIRDKDSAEKLSRQVDVASSMLSDYNGRLCRELEDRKQVSIMLATYIKNQKDLLSLSEQKLNEYKDKLKRVNQVRTELKSHLQNLPDLSLLPSVTGGLAPLPSADDLFNIVAARNEHRYMTSMGSTSSASPNSVSPTDYESMTTPFT